MKKTLIASELDDIFDDDDIVYIETELSGIQRHPSDKGSVITDMGKKIFVPDAQYRRLKLKMVNYSTYYGFYFKNERNPRYLLWENLPDNDVYYDSLRINKIVLDYNSHVPDDISLTAFDYCNNIKVPKVGNCIIPNCDELELIFSYADEIDKLDKSITSIKYESRGLAKIIYNSDKFILSCSFVKDDNDIGNEKYIYNRLIKIGYNSNYRSNFQISDYYYFHLVPIIYL